MSIQDLLNEGPRVINVGLPGFAADLRAQGLAVSHVAWTPPLAGTESVLDALDAFELQSITAEGRNGRVGDLIDSANQLANDRLLRADPVWCDVQRAGDAITGLERHVVLHAGPPVDWENMCGPMRGAICGAAVFEGWASTLEEAERMAAAGTFDFQPNHHFDAVGPMTGITTESMALMVVRNRTFSNVGYCTINEGLGKVMRFGGNDESVRDRLRWLGEELGPLLGRALRAGEPIALRPIVARGLGMGDEMHQRNAACTGLLLRELAPRMADVATDPAALARALAFIAGNDQFFLNMAMAMGKVIADPARNVPMSSLVVAMSRNGTDFGVQLAGTANQWFTAPVEMPRGLYFPGFTEADANPDMGDSTIVETVGLGGFAMAASPAVAGFVGAGGAKEAVATSQQMYQITVGQHSDWTIPYLDFRGVPHGIDARLVLRTGITPMINTGIAHREPGIGQVGAGVVNAPMACFAEALSALCEAGVVRS